MTENRFRLLALDVDGTLLNSRGQMSAHTVQTLRQLQEGGVCVVLASGRPLEGLEETARRLELDQHGGYVVAYNGSLVLSASSGQVIYERSVQREMLPYLERKVRQAGLELFTYAPGELLCTGSGNAYTVGEARLNGLRLRTVRSFADEAPDKLPKCVVTGEDTASLQQLCTHWQRRLSGTVEVVMSQPHLLEILPCGVSKAAALAALQTLLQISGDEVMAIGDGECDVDMLQQAGLGVAMAHALPKVRHCADAVTLSNDQEGVAFAVEQHLLHRNTLATRTIEELNAASKNTLMSALGIRYTFATVGRVEAVMPVSAATRQPFGILHGGATLALAETVAGAGSIMLCGPQEVAVGMQVSGNHLSSAREDDTVRAVATILHQGRTTHVWNVDVFTSTDKLVSSVRVINSIKRR